MASSTNPWANVKPSFMLALDTKKTTQLAIDKPLHKYIEEQGFSAESYGSAISEVNNLRESIRNSTDKSEAILGTYQRYYALISSLERRVPITEQEVRLQFCWYDILKGRKASTQR